MVSRVAWARVVVAQGSGAPVDDLEVTGEIGPGILALVGVGRDDGPAEAAWLADKLAGLRIFEDDHGVPNRDVGEAGGGVLVVSQFTLYGDARRGRRPSYLAAARPQEAAKLVEAVGDALAARGLTVGHGRFGAVMRVESAGDGPFTILLDSDRNF